MQPYQGSTRDLGLCNDLFSGFQNLKPLEESGHIWSHFSEISKISGVLGFLGGHLRAPVHMARGKAESQVARLLEG